MSTSLNLWVIKIMLHRPSWAKAFKANKISSASCGVSTDVGSSKINKLGFKMSCFKISSFCFSPADKPSGVRCKASLKGVLCTNASNSSLTSRQLMTGVKCPLASSKFSATVMPGITVKC